MRHILFSAAACLGLLSAPARADITLSFNNLAFDDGPARWDGYTYVARDVVGSLNALGAAAAEAGHHALELDRATPQARLLYLVAAGGLNFRFQWANSLMFGHEMVHWQHARRFGLTDHYFRERDGARISASAMYRKLLFTGAAKPTAVSADEGAFNEDLYRAEGIETSLHAINWQMSYSEEWLKDSFFEGDKSVFDTTDYFINRLYLTSYALGDYRHPRSTTGDMAKFARHLAPNDDPKSTLGKITLISAAAALISPGLRDSVEAWRSYVNTGRIEAAPPSSVDSLWGRVTWDVPSYLNKDAFTLAPTVYLLADAAMAAGMGADRVLLSAGVETSVMGESVSEWRLGAKGRWGETTIDSHLTLGEAGELLEVEIAYDVNDHVALYTGGAVISGTSLRGKRNLPEGQDVVWMGARMRF